MGISVVGKPVDDLRAPWGRSWPPRARAWRASPQPSGRQAGYQAMGGQKSQQMAPGKALATTKKWLPGGASWIKLRGITAN